jgi:hypothetical protein
MSKVTSGIVLFSLLMALSLGVAFGSDVAATGNVSENATNATNVTNVTNATNATNVTAPINVTPVEATAVKA